MLHVYSIQKYTDTRCSLEKLFGNLMQKTSFKNRS